MKKLFLTLAVASSLVLFAQEATELVIKFTPSNAQREAISDLLERTNAERAKEHKDPLTETDLLTNYLTNQVNQWVAENRAVKLLKIQELTDGDPDLLRVLTDAAALNAKKK